ncbi:cyclic-phosphate processing receiver domain-containing protein [Nocardia wallacei]|uniref:cyclic-phosphate processing receiver domain-containing protein n=1 Tax=Nocardia wallacei TaxID=480035 RepID=UPI002454423B|nr:cyclic-phosphate processing receiver domain-containing protein [Nocardia wallacei]
MKLYVDDLRTPPDGWMVVRSSLEAITHLHLLRAHGETLDALSLDHDLGGDDTTRPIMLWMCEHNWWPQAIYVHSANMVGADWLEGMADRYGPDHMLRGWA